MKATKSILFLSIIFLPFHTIAQKFRIPAEWENQDDVWLTWFGNERRDSITCRVIEALQPQVKILINVESDLMKNTALKYMGNYTIDKLKIEFFTDPYVDFFIRDYVFFVKDKKEKLQIVCFDYSSYGMFPDLTGVPMPEEEKKFGKWDERLAIQMSLPTINSEYVFEGGGIEANGSGTLLVIREMALQRNPTKSIQEIEEELKKTLGARKIIWLEKGLIEDKKFPKSGPFYKNYFGGGTNMHIDELCRFVDKNTVVLPYISFEDRNNNPVDSINYPILEANFNILKNATTANGKKIKIIRIPMPEIDQLKFTLTIEETEIEKFKDFGLIKGDTIYRIPATSYCNYFVSNKVVLIPKYWKPGMSEKQKQKDEEVYKVFNEIFPKRQIIQIYTLNVNRGGGGIHCMTHEVPISKH